ncbi:hypothetical protein OHA79_09620 [Streptomyces sp. NBC_00841]|uniref:hypothetical protein n=1 Tax=Streptomyces sp. NBC_00841 TaxID=2975847 RepID=UPI002DD8D436|nr:hypothetical protein [Streptomyces sp. NBC_00841]WRZ98073.1 hypothetical protein OHA79_09620 [Streptomyces sp. NBC_00841]
MSGMFMQSVTILRAPLVIDKYGNPSSVRDWARATTTVVNGVSVQPSAGTEIDADRQTVISGWRLFTRTGVDIDLLPTDRVVSDGVTAEVDGEVARFRLSGRVHHVEAQLKRVTG